MADAVEGPDEGCQGWDWPVGEFLMLMFHRSPCLPGLQALVAYDAWTARAELAGRPVAVTRAPAEVAEAGGRTFRAQIISGYVDDRTSFWADIAGQGLAEQLVSLLRVHQLVVRAPLWFRNTGT